MTRQNLFTIAPDAPFLATLADRILDGTLVSGWDLTGPFGFADITIILPTRRARLALAEAFTRRLGGVALLPDIRTLGGAPEEEEPFLPPFEAPPIPGAVRPLTRKLMLAELIEKWIAVEGPNLPGFASPPSAAEILGLSESLCELIDECRTEGVKLDQIARLDTGDRSGHWQENLKFLELALSVWPGILAERGEVDMAERRSRQLRRQAEAAPLIYGDRPVIAAGSTGSIPATADLLKAIAGLPRGALVLPGLDTSLTSEQFAAIRDPARAPHGHPQYGLCRLLDHLGSKPAEVEELGGAPAPRTRLVRQALALADHTAHWSAQRNSLEAAFPEALDGLSIAIARTDEEQARAIALAARATLEKGETVGIVSPDRNLARRIVNELARFDVGVDDSAGTPLVQSRLGRLIRQLLALSAEPGAPVPLMALLRNRRTTLGLDRAKLNPVADRLELALLRGQRPRPGFDGLRAQLAANLNKEIDRVPYQLDEDEGMEIAGLLDRLEEALTPLITLFDERSFSAAAFAMALEQSLAALTAQGGEDRPQPLPEQPVLADWLQALKTERDTGPRLSASGIATALDALMAGTTVRTPGPSRTDIAIWGQLEARLQNPDLMILAGLSEGVWPEIVDPGPWLSRAMRIELGLEPPERRQGQAAHDFEMALGNRNVLITRAERIGTSPAVTSRLLQRLEAFIGADNAARLKERGALWIANARDLDFAGPAAPADRPAPKPPVRLRPNGLSITEVETLIRSPYDLYAKYVLRLRKLDPLGDDPGARERGTLVHAIFARFVEESIDPGAEDALARMMEIADSAFAALDALPERRLLWRERFRPAAEAFLAFEQARQNTIQKRHAELQGNWTFPIAGNDFTLRGRADRIDQMVDGTLEIIDFKTGAVPAPKDMQAFTAPQLLLEAAMAAEEAFSDVPAADTSALTYIKIGAGPDAFGLSGFRLAGEHDVMSAADEVVRRLALQAEAYLFSEETPMAARIFPDPNQRHEGDYDHLARTGEWASIEGGDGE